MFSSKRSYYLMQSYEVYTMTTPNNSYGFDDNQIGIEAAGHFRSGFKYGAGLLNNRLVASAVYNWIMPPSYDSDRDLKAYSVLLRYYIGGWSAVNIAMHAEYTYHITRKAVKLNENMFILGLDFAL